MLVVTNKRGAGNGFESVVFREILVAPELFQRAFINGKLRSKPDNTVRMVMGHARAATLGAVTKDNCHPFSFSNVTGCHNGTVHNMVPMGLTDKERETNKGNDSWNIYNHMNSEGLDSTLDKIKNGAYALTWIDKKNDTLNFIRNEKRTLFFASNGGTMYWASEREFLEMIKSRSGFPGNLKIKEVEPHVHYSLSLKSTHGIKLDEQDKSHITKLKVTASSNTGSALIPWTSEWEEALEEKEETKPVVESKVVVLQPPKESANGHKKISNRFADIATSPNVSTLKTLDYFQIVNNENKVVAEPCEEEMKELLKENFCCNCGSVVSVSSSPSAGLYSSDPEDLSTYYLVCGTCISEGETFFVNKDYEDQVLQVKPVYVKVN